MPWAKMSDTRTHIELARSGGFAGITLRSSLDTSQLPPEEAEMVEALVDNADLGRFPAVATRPGEVDRFQYDLVVTRGGQRHVVSVGERDLTPKLRQLIDEVLARHGTRTRRDE